MSAKTAVAERRQVRRVLGEDARALLAACQEGLERQGNMLKLLRAEHDALRQAWNTEASQVTEIVQPLRRRFWGRLRWLVRGQ